MFFNYNISVLKSKSKNLDLNCRFWKSGKLLKRQLTLRS